MNIHICISGFTQHEGRMSGLMKLSEKMIASGFSIGRHSRVWLFRWDANWSRVAEHVSILSEKYEVAPLIGVYAYSWGAGWGAMQLSKQLLRRGQQVRAMVLSDPVYRHPWFPFHWFSMLSRDIPILRAPIIYVPKNVHEVWHFNQTLNRPQGHRLISTNGTEIHYEGDLGCIHQKMDEHYRFHDKALDVATMLTDEKKWPRTLYDNCRTVICKETQDVPRLDEGTL